jgi:hypothetical protein
VWAGLPTIEALRVAGRELNERRFFTRMLRIADLVQVPAVEHAISSQYSEGCFGAWDPTLGALIATITGSARPVDKGNITEDDLAVIVGVRPDGRGALVRHVEGKHNSPPSSEAVEMMGMDAALPRFPLPGQPGVSVRRRAPSCTGIGASRPTTRAMSSSRPSTSRTITILFRAPPKRRPSASGRRSPARRRCATLPIRARQRLRCCRAWRGDRRKVVAGKAPFQTIWEYMDAGYLTVANLIPQGRWPTSAARMGG